MTTVFAIIVTYNAMRKQWIERCLESLRQSTQSVTPVVIDNYSTDKTQTFVANHYPEAILLPQKDNLGFGQANNIGISYALEHHADFILLLNQDAALHPQALALMLAESDGLSLISPLHMNGQGTALDHNFQEYTLKAGSEALFNDIFAGHGLQGSYPIGEVAAACWLMPATLVRKIGGFNPLFFQYSEDNNYFHRMVYHHVGVRLVPAALMYHDRKQQGDMQAFNLNLLHRKALLFASDINMSPLRCMANLSWLFAPWQPYRFTDSVRELLWIVSHLRTIIRSRRKEKKEGLNWL